MNQSTLKKFLRLPHFEDHLALHRLDCLASNGILSSYDFVKKKLEETPPAVLRPRPLLTGDDLIAAGYAPGPRFKEMLAAVEDKQLENTLQRREQALEFVRARFPLQN
jgi:poly(A) polymerase